MMDELLVINLVRFIVGLGILSYASYTDIKIRKAYTILWWIMAIIGIILLIIQYFTPSSFGGQILYLLFIPIIFGFMFVIYLLPINFGGADIRAICALSILVPFTPSISIFPLYPSLMPFVWVIFVNALLFNLIVPLYLFVFNIFKKDISFPYCFLGYKTSIKKAKDKFLWPLQKIENGKSRIYLFNHSYDRKKEFESLEKEGYDTIWVTPWVPFIIPLLAGYISAFIFGDILTYIIQWFL